MSASRFAIVGTGRRPAVYHAVARALPHDLELTGVVARTETGARQAADRLGVPAFTSLPELKAAGPIDFVLVCVPRAAAPDLIEESVALGFPTLVETPPAADLAALHQLWARVGSGDRVHVAEQYPRYPGHRARRELLRSGMLGRPTSVQVSSTHEYHAVALIRDLLGTGFAPTTVRASRFAAPLLQPFGSAGRIASPVESPAETVLATLDFGDSMGLYDFSTDQWYNPLRHRRIVARATRGEISDDHVVRWQEPDTVLESTIDRRRTGHDLDLTGFETDHLSFEGRVLWRNEVPGARFSDEEHAIASLLRDAGRWAAGDGEGPYPLAEACQDQAVSLAIRDALESGAEVRLPEQPWAVAR